MRWIRELINSLLPVAGVGGDIVGARLVHQRGVPGAQAAASTVVDITVGAATQVVFVVAGVTPLATGESAHAAPQSRGRCSIGAAVFAAAIGAFVLVQHNSMFGLFARQPGGSRRRIGCPVSPAAPRPSTMRSSPPIAAASPCRAPCLLRFAGWVIGAGEIWLATHVLGKPLSRDRCACPRKPRLRGPRGGVHGARALGAQEGGLVLFGALFGLPADLALAISLTKRVRELALGLPGLAAWQWVEGRRWLARRADKASSAP